MHNIFIVIAQGLRQHEGFSNLSVWRSMGNIKAGIKSVITSAAENKPTAVTTPGMITFYIREVVLLFGMCAVTTPGMITFYI